MTQPDLLRDSPAVRAQQWRTQAETARNDPYWRPEERERRAAYYEAQAQRILEGE